MTRDDPFPFLWARTWLKQVKGNPNPLLRTYCVLGRPRGGEEVIKHKAPVFLNSTPEKPRLKDRKGVPVTSP